MPFAWLAFWLSEMEKAAGCVNSRTARLSNAPKKAKDQIMLRKHVGTVDPETSRELDYWLECKGYAHDRRQNIRFELFLTGDFASALERGLLAVHHEAGAYAIIEAGIPEVPLTSADWDEDRDRWDTLASLPDEVLFCEPPHYDDDFVEPADSDVEWLNCFMGLNETPPVHRFSMTA
jgi:hypothetical protein